MSDRSRGQHGVPAPRPSPPVPLTSTYRVQLNASFTLNDARGIVPYLHTLGVSHIYTSPVLTAKPGSLHGYDVVDPTAVSAELGGEEALRALAGALHERGMGLLVDIVPNHMGANRANPFWMDLLRHGRGSRWAHWFDVDWDADPAHRGKVVLPVLGDELEKVLARGELRLEISEHEGAHFAYFDRIFPIDPTTLPDELQLVQWDPGARDAARAFVHGPEGHRRMRELLDAQHYRLIFWRKGPQLLNYRRFFDVNDLVALRMEDPRVFEETHALILKLVEEGVIDGLRVDHVDGLRDPLGYLRALRERIDSEHPFPIFVEKILSPGEKLRAEWPVQGTTGYEFLNDLEATYIDHQGFLEIERWYRRARRLAHRTRDLTFAETARDGKLAVLRGPLLADMKRLAAQWAGAGSREPGALPAPTSQRPTPNVVQGLISLLASLPVYRTYIDGRTPEAAPEDRAVLERAVARAEEVVNAGEHAVVAQVARELLAPLVPGEADYAQRLDFILTLQQVSGPATAKGVEDTALYQYVPLVSRNEVGGDPDRPLHDAVARLHEANAERAARWPLALVCTDTHDTKRSADVRARLDVLSEASAAWERSVNRWRRLNRPLRAVVRGRLTPDTNTEYLFYQTLVGLWPAPPAGRRADDLPGRGWLASAAKRLDEYMLKAVREAKLWTSWTEPDVEYEQAVSRFVRAALDPDRDSPFLADVARLVTSLARPGLWTALSRALVHFTAPGTPDTYQGSEWWKQALVDPDNRQPVDYAARAAMLDDLARIFPDSLAGATRAARLHDLARTPEDTRLKQYLVWRALTARRARAPLFTEGEYLPLEVTGERAGHVIAFARRRGSELAVVVAPRLLCDMIAGAKLPVGSCWGDTRVTIPPEIGDRTLCCVLSGRTAQAEHGTLLLARLFVELPMALLLTH